ncbi:hypothetical protein OIV56_13530 [Burkholderia pseudomallei]|uniref:hypothetical protein n=1 Tax=Burkholderia pseudomallei TaxID=28450 RepID=UPI000F0D7BEF|nr:hypothetical protein [Burkholderia pseudomallei]MCW0163748.1 hypothetical protein [Burkholderia pseudomallei]VBG63451.1 Uncharacterised protein [Burkholderia pseudomallei]
MNASFNFAQDLKIEVFDADSIENFVSNKFDERGDRIEEIDGYFTFYELAVEAFGRTFNVRTQEEPDGRLVVPSNEYVGDEMGSNAMNACPEYFALLQTLVQKYLGIEFSEDDYDMPAHEHRLPENILELHYALVAHLKAVLTEEIAATA